MNNLRTSVNNDTRFNYPREQDYSITGRQLLPTSEKETALGGDWYVYGSLMVKVYPRDTKKKKRPKGV
jgi:hypothetical protein